MVKYERVNLSVFDRVILLNILDAEVDKTIYKIFNELLGELSFSEEEMEKFGICYTGDYKVKWKESIDKIFHIGPIVLEIIKSRLASCKDKEMLTDDHDELYNKFLGESVGI